MSSKLPYKLHPYSRHPFPSSGLSLSLSLDHFLAEDPLPVLALRFVSELAGTCTGSDLLDKKRQRKRQSERTTEESNSEIKTK